MSSPPDANSADTARRLHSFAIHLLRALRRHDLLSGVGPARLSALSVVVFRGPATLGELAEAEQVRPPTMSRIVAALERDGLVRRQPDASDGRRAHIHPTAAGRKLLEKARGRRVAELAEWVKALSPREREQVTAAVDVLERMLSGRRR
jgi:DNA-binding MarR family transcriptional regulator